MSEAVVTLKKGEGRTIKAGGMWIFDNEIQSIMGTFENGDIGRPTDHYIESRNEMKTSSLSTNNQERYNQEKGKMTANFLDFVQSQGRTNN